MFVKYSHIRSNEFVQLLPQFIHAGRKLLKDQLCLTCWRCIGTSNHTRECNQLGTELNGKVQYIQLILCLDLKQFLFERRELLLDLLANSCHRLLDIMSFCAALPPFNLPTN